MDAASKQANKTTADNGRSVNSLLLLMTANEGDLPKLEGLLDRGANPDCWTLGGGSPRPLALALARKGQVSAARMLVERITDEMIAAHNMGDWRRDYDLSPLREFAHAGMEDIALVMLGHCQDEMNSKQWQDLLFQSVRGDTLVLVEKCIRHVDQAGMESVAGRLGREVGMLLPAWGVAMALHSQSGLDMGTGLAEPGIRRVARI